MLRDWVVDESVRWSGEMFDLELPSVEQLERQEIVERVNEEDYRDTMKERYPTRDHLTPSPFPEGKGSIKDVLVFTPVLRLEGETVEAVLKLEREGAVTWIFQEDNPNPHPGPLPGRERDIGLHNHLHQFQRGRETFLKGRYDALLTVESDIVPPPDALRRLAAVDADIVYGVYRFRQVDVINVFELPMDGKYREIGTSLSEKKYLLKRAVKQGVYPCAGIGFGCTLIRRHVLEAIEFRIREGVMLHCDVHFANDALKAGFSQAAEMNVICGHVDENGKVLWPRLPTPTPP